VCACVCVCVCVSQWTLQMSQTSLCQKTTFRRTWHFYWTGLKAARCAHDVSVSLCLFLSLSVCLSVCMCGWGQVLLSPSVCHVRMLVNCELTWRRPSSIWLLAGSMLRWRRRLVTAHTRLTNSSNHHLSVCLCVSVCMSGGDWGAWEVPGSQRWSHRGRCWIIQSDTESESLSAQWQSHDCTAHASPVSTSTLSLSLSLCRTVDMWQGLMT